MSAVLKDREFRNPELLKLANGQECQNCGDTYGVVAAHANWLDFGKGKSHKAHDCYHAWLCMRCHAFLDQGTGMDPTKIYSDIKQDKREMWQRAANRTLLELWRQGLIKVAR